MTAPTSLPVRRRTLGDALEGRDNGLNFTRLCLAIAVIFAHSWVFGGHGETRWVDGAEWAVNGFFVISGYLIVGSRLRLSFREFFWRRALRIFPAFWVVILLTGLAVSPVAAALAGEEFAPWSGVTYVTKNFFLYIGQPGIADTLESTPLPYVWNLSLWTLIHEFSCYIAVGLLLSVSWIRKHALVAFVAVLVLLVMFRGAALTVLDLDLSVYVKNALRLGAFFAAGAVLFFVRDRVRLSWPWLLGSLAATVVLFATNFLGWVGHLPFAILILILGAWLPVRLGSRNDVSYGVYIWAAPIQQCLALAGIASIGALPSAFIALGLVLPIATASWFFIEQPAMRLKHLVRGRRPDPSPRALEPNAPSHGSTSQVDTRS